MLTLGKVSYTEAYVRVAAQLGGGLVAFPLFHAIAEAMKLEPVRRGCLVLGRVERSTP